MIARLHQFAPPGRLADLEVALAQAWTDARERRPTTVVLQGDPGVGKTRLVQEFFRALSGVADPDGYWPTEMRDTHKAMTIVPELSGRSVDATPPLPWLWLALRCTDPGGPNRNAGLDVAFDVVPRQLRVHLAGLYRAQLLHSRNTALAKTLLSVVASFALPGGGGAIDALETAIKGVDTSLDTWSAFDAVVKRARAGAGRRDPVGESAIAAERMSLGDSAVQAFRAIAASSRHKRVIPLVLVVDDAQWADPVTLGILDRLLATAWREGWPLLTIIAAWTEDIPAPAHCARPGSIADLLAAGSGVGSGRPAVRRHRLEPLDGERMCDLVRRRCPGLSREAAEMLAARCSGDLDLLYDFLDELVQAPGWLDTNGVLIGEPSVLATLPSQALTMARQRLRSIDPPIVDALSLASAEGVVFHLSLIGRVAEVTPDDDDLRRRIELSNEAHGITALTPHRVLDTRGEFRRHVYWEVCSGDLARLPERHARVLRRLAEALRDLVREPRMDAALAARARTPRSTAADDRQRAQPRGRGVGRPPNNDRARPGGCPARPR